MPSSPKLFYARPSTYTRGSTILLLCVLFGLSGFIFGFIAISRNGLENKCKYGKPLSVSVAWDRSSTGSLNGEGSDLGQKRHKVMGFVGIQTGFGSAGRRRSLRQTWFPSDHQSLQRYTLCLISWLIYYLICWGMSYVDSWFEFILAMWINFGLFFGLVNNVLVLNEVQFILLPTY